jgi:hypothetical protein
MDQQLVIKLTSDDGNGVPIGLVESPPMLYINFKELHKDISFSEIMVSSELLPYSYAPFEWVQTPPIAEEWNKIYEHDGLGIDEQGVWKEIYTLRDLTQDEINTKISQKKEQISAVRYVKLKKCDWTQLPDASDKIKQDIEAWKTYRQALRDITKKEGYPWMGTHVESLDWPLKPDGTNEIVKTYPYRWIEL